MTLPFWITDNRQDFLITTFIDLMINPFLTLKYGRETYNTQMKYNLETEVETWG